MKVTLRKAAQIISQIQNWKNENTVTPGVMLSKSTVTNAREFLTSGAAKFTQFAETTLRLNDITYRIKNAVGVKNTEVGITERVGEMNGVETSIKFINTYRKWLDQPVNIEQTEVLFQQMQSDANQDWRYSTIEASFVEAGTTDSLKNRLSQLKKRKNVISDELVALNSSNHVVIDDADYAFLESLDIV